MAEPNGIVWLFSVGGFSSTPKGPLSDSVRPASMRDAMMQCGQYLQNPEEAFVKWAWPSSSVVRNVTHQTFILKQFCCSKLISQLKLTSTASSADINSKRLQACLEPTGRVI